MNKTKRLSRKQVRALQALNDGSQMNTSLANALFTIPDELVDFDASEGSDSIGVKITEKGMAALKAHGDWK